MASLSKVRRGKGRKLWRLDFNPPNGGSRRTVWLGNLPREQVERIKVLVHDLIDSWNPSLDYGNALTTRLDELPPKIRAKLQHAGLCTGPRTEHSLDDLIKLLMKRPVKGSTMETYRQAAKSLRDFLPAGGETPVHAITQELAMAWRSGVAQGLAQATCAKRTNVLKSMFGSAVSAHWLQVNPFSAVRSGSQINEQRLVFVNEATVDQVLNEIEDKRLRAVVALARYGGLRVPSEVVGLTWEQASLSDTPPTIQIFAPKTQQRRIVPVRKKLLQALVALTGGVQSRTDPMIPGLGRASNMRTALLRAIECAGVEPWPRLFQNLRASAATDWAQKFPPRDVSAWMGHSAVVALEHYHSALPENVASAADM
jgi:integrase